MMESTISRVLRLCLAVLLALAALFALNLALGRATPAAGQPLSTFTVDNTNDAGAGSLRQALLDANAMPGADIIDISAVGVVNLLSPLPTITGSVTIQGPGADLFAVDGQDLYRVLDIAAVEVAISALTVQRGAAAGAGANGAGIRSLGDLSLSHVQVLSNTAQGHGGGVDARGSVTVTGGLFHNNHSTNGIGGALRTNRLATISGTHFVQNTSQGDGGALFALGQNAITNTLFLDNGCLAGSCDGGGLFAFSQTTVQNTHFLSNTAQDDGGGAFIAGVVTVTNSLFQNNRSVTSSGGGLGAQDNAVVRATQFLSNTARGSGGGLAMFGSLHISDALFLANHSSNSLGGGLDAQGDLEATRLRFMANSAREGGALAHTLYDATVVNSLFAANSASDAVGASLLLASPGAAELLHLTIAGAPAGSGAAVEVISGTAGITNTILTGHTVGISSAGATVFQDYNLFFANGADVQGPVSGGGHSLVGDPLFLNPLGHDYHLNAASPAVDAGIGAGVTTDFDGEPRPLGLTYDIGFDEVMPASPAHTIYLPALFH